MPTAYFIGQMQSYESVSNTVGGLQYMNSNLAGTYGTASDPIDGGASSVNIDYDTSNGIDSTLLDSFNVVNGPRDTMSVDGGAAQDFSSGFTFLTYTITYDDGSTLQLNTDEPGGTTAREADFRFYQDTDGNTYLVSASQTANDALNAGNVVSISASGPDQFAGLQPLPASDLGTLNADPDAVDDTATFDADEGSGSFDSLNLLDNDSDPDGNPLTITEVNGQPVPPGGAFFDLAGGGQVFVNPNGQVDFGADGDFDGLALGESANTGFTYTVSDGNGGTSTADANFTVNGVCFCRDTLIDTDQGEVAIQDLKEGMMVRTRDNGFQPIRWIGMTPTFDRAIRIKAGALGNSRDLVVSPRHRMVLDGWQLEMLFDHKHALVTARELVNDDTIVRDPMAGVEYYHVMFDAHEVIYAEGAPTESFHPDQPSMGSMDKAVRAEIFALFPELETGAARAEAAPSLTATQAAYVAKNLDAFAS